MAGTERKPEMNKAVIFLTLLFMLLSACAGGTSAGDPNPAGNMKEYVGEVAGTAFYVAIAVGPAGEVLAYVCDGMGTDYLFHGTHENGSMTLASDAGQATLSAALDGGSYNGTFSVGGSTYSFDTVPAQDYGGLYRVRGLSEFEAEGRSQGGATLQMNLSPDREHLQVTVTTSDGQVLSYDRPWPAGEHDHREPTEYSESWLIFLNDSRARGGHIRTSIKAGIRHIDPICPP